MTNSEESRAQRESSDEVVMRAPRSSVFLKATLQKVGSSEKTEHRVRDLSSGGMRVDQAHLLAQGATLLVTVGAVETVEATVAWIDGTWAGLKFEQQIEPDEARAKTAVAPKREGDQWQDLPRLPTAPVKVGWLTDLRDPYRR